MNKKVSLITVHTGPNFGTVLQVIATSRVLERHGFTTEVVNYIPPRDELCSLKKTIKDRIKQTKSPLRKVIRFLGGVDKIRRFKNNERIYIGCLKQNVSLSAPIHSYDSFKEGCPLADFYVTGSDQVWNTIYNEGVDSHYFFYGVDGVKIAFSSSIGQTELNDEEKHLFRKYLKDYRAISVRESSAVELLKSIGIDTMQLIDPTLMINREEWGKMVDNRLFSKKYLLVYIPYNIHDKEEIYRLARRVAVSRNLKVVTFSWSNLKEPLADYTFRGASPMDFLSLIYHADYVITNSFHGTAFSVNLNRDFFVFLPTKFVSRVENILDMVQLRERLIPFGKGDETDISTPVMFEKANAILKKKREEVDEFIMKSFV